MPTPKPHSDPRAGDFLLAQQAPEEFWAFHPRPLPPDPPLEIDAELQVLLDAANQALGRLDGITLLLPDPDQFLYSFVRKEAVLSSQIEGTQSSLSDLLLFENGAAPAVSREDAEDTASYIAALNHGMDSLRSGRLPLCARLLREIHGILLGGGRGSDKGPGEFRANQNWIGGSRPGNARYVPPPANQVEPMMSDLEKFLHGDPEPTPVLVKAALAHVQFETVHPFYDGNGRVGRMLITLLLADDGVLEHSLLYLSLFLKQNRDAYYDHLHRVRTEGAFEEWLSFVLDGVTEVAASTTETIQRIVQMIERDRGRIRELGRGAATAGRVHHLAARVVAIRARSTAQSLELSEPPVYAAIARLQELGILREVTGRQRNKLYVYDEYLALLNEGTADPPS